MLNARWYFQRESTTYCVVYFKQRCCGGTGIRQAMRGAASLEERENVRVDYRCSGICTEPSYRELWSGTVYMHMIRILSQYMTVDHIIMVLDGSVNGNEGF